MPRVITIKVLDLPGSIYGARDPVRLAGEIENLRGSLGASFPGLTSVEYHDLHDSPERNTCAGQLLVNGRFTGPVVLVDGEVRFAGALRIHWIVKAVRLALERPIPPQGGCCPGG